MKSFKVQFMSMALAGCMTLLAAIPASAEDAAPSANPSAEANGQDGNYVSLAAAMANFYAKSKGATLAQYVSENPEQVAALLGTSVDSLGKLPTDSVQSLEGSLGKQDLLLDTSSYSDLSLAKQDLLSKSGTLDSLIVSNAASYASQMAALRSQDLATPSVSGFDSSIANTMPSESLAFGLFLDKSLANFVTNSPDVFSSISSTGLGTAQAQEAWKKSMSSALAGSQGDLSAMLPSKCGAVFLTAMASGDAKSTGSTISGSGDCGSCLVAGLYSNGQMSALFDPSIGRVNPIAGSGTINPAEWQNMTSWQKNALTNSNDGLSQALDNALGLQKTQKLTGGCETSGKAVSNSAGASLKKTLSYLNK